MDDNGVYHLGALELCLARANLSLRLASEVKFVTSKKDEGRDPAPAPKLIESLLNRGDTRRPWISKSHGYRLVIELHIAPELDIEKEQCVQDCATRLKHSKFWESLGLSVTSIETWSSHGQVTVWTISLEYNEQASLPTKARLHKLSPHVPFYDTKPPSGIHTLKLEAVRVTLALKPVPTLATHASNLSEFNGTENTNDCFEDDDAEMLLHETYEGDYADNSHDNPDDRWLAIAQGQFCNHMQRQIDKTVTQSQRVCATSFLTGDCPYLTPPISQEEKVLNEDQHHEHVYNPHTLQAPPVSRDTLLSAFETGLRYAISKLPTRKSRTTVVVGNEGMRCLSSIAPALWLPDYHRSLSEHAVFLPTISRAIANISAHTSANNPLKEKFRQLVRHNLHGSIPTSPRGPHVSLHEAQKAVSARLWQMMSLTLHGTASAKRMQMLSDGTPPINDTKLLENPEAKLDDISTHSKFDQSCDESDFGDCVEALSEPEEREICDWDGVDDFASNLCSLHSCWTEGLEDSLLDRWNLQRPPGVDHDSDMVDTGLEPHGNGLAGVEGSVESGDRRLVGGNCAHNL